MIDYEKLITRINARSNPEQRALEKAFAAKILDIQYGNVEKFIRLAMRGVEPAYTSISREARKKVQNHLKEALEDVIFKYQGSVETNTHIIANSDIDLLVISDKSYLPDRTGIQRELAHQNFPSYQKIKLQSALSAPRYSGDPIADLKRNRSLSEQELLSKYMDCDTDGPKAIRITNRSLKRDVDIVIAGSYKNTETFLNEQNPAYLGVQIYNKEKNIRENPDFPFLKIKLLNERSGLTNGRLKKMIRFLKNIKAEINLDQDPEPIKMSSFQFNAIFYDLELYKYEDKTIFELVSVVYFQLKKLYENDAYRNNLTSVDGSEFIFKGKEEKTIELRLLMEAILPILKDLQTKSLL